MIFITKISQPDTHVRRRVHTDRSKKCGLRRPIGWAAQVQIVNVADFCLLSVHTNLVDKFTSLSSLAVRLVCDRRDSLLLLLNENIW